MNEAMKKPQSGWEKHEKQEQWPSGNGGVFAGVSLQDVFSDSAGRAGLMLKTISRPVVDGGNASQLGVPEKKRKRRVGRKQLVWGGETNQETAITPHGERIPRTLAESNSPGEEIHGRIPKRVGSG
ncbi:MAG: hypothetical protein U5K79_03695 [Cyclobacteriaceae bacterium]|nr:hypothetical protein [Cyclobacteriaceae bacterium]